MHCLIATFDEGKKKNLAKPMKCFLTIYYGSAMFKQDIAKAYFAMENEILV